MTEEEREIDRQEAESVKYVDALRVIKLTSGRWAVSKLWSGAKLEIMDVLSEHRLTEMLAEQAREVVEFKARVQPRRRAEPAGGTVDIDIEELFR